MTTPTDADITTLDHIDNITVPGSPFRAPANEYWALICLHDGMDFLYRQALRCDHIVKQRVNPEGKVRYFGGGNDPSFDGVPKTLLTCAFHWYSISACQYVRTVGAIAYRLDRSRPLPPDYVKRVVPEVAVFRNKVAAHFAWATENDRDNDAERLASILLPLTFHDDSFYVGGWTVGLGPSGMATSSEAIQPWSLCKVHESLTKRYWPDQQAHDRPNAAAPGAAPDRPHE
jgi:hypothetical protein